MTHEPPASRPGNDQPTTPPWLADSPPPRPATFSREIVAEASRSLRVEHWRDGEQKRLTGLDALRHSVGESSARHWVDLAGPSRSLVYAVAAELGLHPLVAEDIEERNQRPKVELTDGHAHIVAFALRWEDGVVATEEVDIVLGRTFLLTVHDVGWDPDASPHLRSGLGIVMGEGIDYLVWALLDTIVDGYFPVFDRIEDEIDALEDLIVRSPGPATLERLFALKRTLVEMRHVMGAQREVFNQLTNRTLPMISADHVIYFRDIYDHAVHLAEEYDSFRDLVSGALDVYLSTVNNGLSETMKRLTGITVVLAGIGAFAGLFGMSEAAPALSGAEGGGFWLVSGGIVALSLLLLVLLRRIRWI